MQEVAELVVLRGDKADPACSALVLGAVLNIHLEERGESLEKVSEARLVRQRRHAPLRTTTTTTTKRTQQTRKTQQKQRGAVGCS